jgi:hypothetical protein
MGYTARKIRGINYSFFLAALVFAGWALVCAWFGWPRSFRGANIAAFALFLLAALFFTAFPIIWARYPEKHPVYHELRRYGKIREISQRLDAEMAGQVNVIGPFRFTKTMLVYDSGLEFQMVPYDQIASAEIVSSADGEPITPAVVVHTRSGRRYQWYRTWLQGIFDAQEVLEKIRAAPHLEDLPDSNGAITADPSTASQAPSAEGSPDSTQSLR